MKILPLNPLKQTRTFFFLAAIMSLGLFAPVEKVSAAPLVIQWDLGTGGGNYTGTVSPGNQVEPGVVTGSIWNAAAPFTGVGSGYVDQNGVSLPGVTMEMVVNNTNATIALSGADGWGGTTPYNWSNGSSSVPIYNTGLMKDEIYTGNVNGIVGVRVSGLAAGTYNVYVPAVEILVPNRSRSIGIGTGVVYSQFGDAQAENPLGDAGTTTTWVNGVNYTYKQVTISGTSDYLDVLVTKYGSDLPSFNGLQIVAVPEPQTWALAALGASAMLFRLRRKARVSAE